MNNMQFETELEEPESARPHHHEGKKRRGCFFYGCLTAVALVVVTVVSMVLVARGVMKRALSEYTVTSPLVLPSTGASEYEHAAVSARLTAFMESLKGDRPAGNIASDGILMPWLSTIRHGRN